MAKIYNKGQGNDGYLALYLKDVVFSTFINNESKVMKPVDIFNDPERIHVYKAVEGGTLARLLEKDLKGSWYTNLAYFYPYYSFEVLGDFMGFWGVILVYSNIKYDDACVIMKQLLDAISVIHEKDIIHRNITPHNIVFERKNDYLSLRIMNFESAIYVGHSEELESHCNEMLKRLEPAEFLKMRHTLTNNHKDHLKGGRLMLLKNSRNFLSFSRRWI